MAQTCECVVDNMTCPYRYLRATRKDFVRRIRATGQIHLHRPARSVGVGDIGGEVDWREAVGSGKGKSQLGLQGRSMRLISQECNTLRGGQV